MYVKTTLMLRLPQELHDQITEHARQANMSMNQWVCYTLSAAVLRQDETITETLTRTIRL